MATKDKSYHQLPGRGSFLLTYAKLYRAEDHLLQVISTGFTESYHRFYFADIQSITIRKTHLGKIVNAVLGAFMLIFSSLSFAPNAEAAAVFLVGLFGIPLVFNIALGPNCVTHIQTAVQRQKLSSLGRLRHARKALKILLPHIEAAQGELTEDALKDHLTYRIVPSTAQAAGPLPIADDLTQPLPLDQPRHATPPSHSP